MAQERDRLGNVTFESSPGGLFDQGDDAQAQGAGSAAAESEDYALDSKGWAIGQGTGSTKGYTSTNNSKYYSEQAAASAAAAAADAAEAKADSEGAAASARIAAEIEARVRMDSDEIAANIAIIDSDLVAARALFVRIDSDAVSADSDARAAERARDAASGSASAAANSANEARIDSEQAAASAAAAARDADLAMHWAIDTDSDNSTPQEYSPTPQGQGSAKWWAHRADEYRIEALEARQDAIIARNQAQADSDEIALNISRALTQISQDSEAVASDLAETQTLASQADTDARRAKSWAVGPSGAGIDGTDTDNARYWALRAEAVTIDTDISDSEITLTAGTGINGGGAFTLNQHANETITFNLDSENIVNATRSGNDITLTYASGGTLVFPIGGGSGPSPASPHLTLTLSPNEVEQQGTGTQTVNATLTANSGFAISDQAFSIRDPDNTNVPVSGSGSTRSYTISRATARTVTISATATLTRSSDDSEFTHQSASAEFHIDLGWYRDLIAAAPTGINSMDNQGIWRDGEMNTQTITANGGNRRLWYALPIRAAGYRFHSGFVVYDVTNHGNINNGSGGADEWTLYSVDDYDDSQNGSTFTVTIEEA